MATLNLPQGTYRGLEANDVESFRGIPFAYHPTRFAPPAPVTLSNPDKRSLDGEIDATTRGPMCPQTPSRLEMVTGPLPPDTGVLEEGTGCLSIFRPAGITLPLPIMVYVHGGGFVSGGSQVGWYDGERLAREGVIVIPIAYRLGAFGFLYGSTTSKHALGVQDLITALEWVHANAVSIGGDATRVCTFGQSAGGYLQQVLLDAVPHLIRRCIIQSSPGNSAQDVKQAKASRDLFLASLPQGRTPETVTTAEFLAAQTQTFIKNQTGAVPFLPTLEQVPGRSKVTTLQGQKHDIVIGWAADDERVFAMMEAGKQRVPLDQAKLPHDKYCTIDEWEAASVALANDLRSNGHEVTLYRLYWKPRGSLLGAVHCIDLPLLLGDAAAWDKAPLKGEATFEEIDVAGQPLRRMWAQFARDGTAPTAVHGVLEIR